MEWQMRNWLYFTWLSGDHIVEQHVHNLDVVNWAMGDNCRSASSASGGRQVRTARSTATSSTTSPSTSSTPTACTCSACAGSSPARRAAWPRRSSGTKGSCDTQDGRRYEINGPSCVEVVGGEDIDPYVQEHTDLIASIRAGKPLNELRQVAESTLTAIMGRKAAYTGKVISLEQFMAAPESIMPAKLEFGPIPGAGRTRAGQQPDDVVVETQRTKSRRTARRSRRNGNQTVVVLRVPS